jgi:hypothetical protein
MKTVFIFVGGGEGIALRREVGIDGADFSSRVRQLVGTVGDVELVLASVELGLDFDQLPIAGYAVGIHFDKRIALAKYLDEGLDLLRLERAVESNLVVGLGFFEQRFLPLLGGQFVESSEDLPGAFSGAGRVRLSDGARKNNHDENQAQSFHALRFSSNERAPVTLTARTFYFSAPRLCQAFNPRPICREVHVDTLLPIG